jgi:competence protein ComEC
VVWWALTRFGLDRGKIYLFSLPGIFLYLLVVGFKLPLLRASLIYLFGGAHFYLERKGLILSSWYDRYQALATAALLLLLLEPEAISTAGFQLSFGATFAIALFIEPIENALKLKPDYLSGILAASIAAQIGVGPVLAVHFGQIHPWAPVANLFAVPAVTLVLYFGLLLLGFGGLNFIGFTVTKLTALIISLTESVVRTLSKLPLATIGVPSVTPLALLSYLILVLWFRLKLGESTPGLKTTNRYLSG